MHLSFRCQSNVLRSYGRERSLIFVYSKKQQVEKNVDCSITSGIDTVFSNFEDVLWLRYLIASRFFLLKLSLFGHLLV